MIAKYVIDVWAVRVKAAVFLEICEDFGVNINKSIWAKISPVKPNNSGNPNLLVINFGNRIVIPVAANINEKNIVTIRVRDSVERLCARRVIGKVSNAKLINQANKSRCFVIVFLVFVINRAINSPMFIRNEMREYPGWFISVLVKDFC